MTFEELAALVPNGHVEPTCSGELVIYTGLALDPKNEDGPLVEWCEECESGGDLGPGQRCLECDRYEPITDYAAASVPWKHGLV